MDNIVSLDDHRPGKGIGAAEVTFFGFRFDPGDGRNHQLSATITIQNGDFETAIEAVKEQGGIYVKHEEDDFGWLLPWPCAAVRVRAFQP